MSVYGLGAYGRGQYGFGFNPAYPKQPYPAGVNTSPSVLLAQGFDYVTAMIDVTDVVSDGAVAARVRVEVSTDGGNVWELLSELTTTGQDAVGRARGFSGEGNSASIGVPTFKAKNAPARIRMVFEAKRPINVATFYKQEKRGFVEQQAEEPHSVAFDAASSTDFANVSSASWTHTPSGTPSGVGIGSGHVSTGATADISSVTYGGVSCTEEVTVAQTVSSVPERASIYRLGSPSSGAQTVAITYLNGNQYGAAGAITVTGGDTSAVFSNHAGASSPSGGAISATCTSATGELVMDCVSETSISNPDVRAAGAGQTERWNRRNASSEAGGGGSTEAGASSVTMSWTRSVGATTDYGWAQVAASFQVAGAAPSLTYPQLERFGHRGAFRGMLN